MVGQYYCVVPESIYTPPKVIGKSWGRGGVLKAKLLEEKYDAKLEFPGGVGVRGDHKPSSDSNIDQHIFT